MTTIQFAENAWAMCSAMFALLLSSICLVLALSVMKTTFNLVASWTKSKKEKKDE